MSDIINVYTDGGSRGNPGPSASGFAVILNGKIIHKGSSYLGQGTNNQAEYNAVIIALNWLNENDSVFYKKDIHFFLDSELVTNQLTGKYKIKDQKLKALAIIAKKLENNIPVKITYHAVRREKNKLADGLVNEELDKHTSHR